MKFQSITNKELAKQLIPTLNNLGYTELMNPTTGRSQDWLCIDTEAKKYSWFEYGFSPDYNELWMYDDKTMKDLFSMYYKQFNT